MVNDAGFVNIATRVQGIIETFAYPLASLVMPEVGIPYYPILPISNVMLETYPPSLLTPMPSRWVYTYPYMPHPIIPSPLITQVDVNPTTLFTHDATRDR